ncbi:MAG: ion transporter [Armatimonadetes bacterium]|nr:ion transporter [Armatimonadota bacterium]
MMAGSFERDPGALRIREWIEDALDIPMALLSFVFLGLVLVDLLVPLPPAWTRRVLLGQWGIWIVFTTEFIVELALADDKRRYLRRNWLAAVSVALPFLRVLRIFRAIRALRALRFFRLSAISGRALRQVGAVLGVRGAGYVALSTLLITVVSAVGMYLLEQGAPDSQITTFGDALWWSAASITTVGSNLAPVTGEGRFLAVIVYLYGMAVIGYIAAVLASYFVGKQMQPHPEISETDRELKETASERAGTSEELQAKVDRLITLLERRAAAPRSPGGSG